MRIRSLTSNLDATLAIAAEKLFEPKFDPTDLERLKARTIEGIRQAQNDASSLADRTRRLLLYGEHNAFAHPNLGTVESVSTLSVEDVRGFYTDRYSPSIADVVVVSDLPRETVVAKLARLERWMPTPVSSAPVEAFPTLDVGTL